MASDFKNEVVRYLRQKADDEFNTITYLGAEQRFVTATRSSGVNNLEEQLLIGTASDSETWVDDDGNTIIKTVFYDSSSTSNVRYELYSLMLDENYKKNTDYYFDGDKVVISNRNGTDVEIVDSTQTINFTNVEVFYFDADGELSIKVPATAEGDMMIQQDSLYYCDNDIRTPVITKTTYRGAYVRADGKTVTQTKEIITNHLK